MFKNSLINVCLAGLVAANGCGPRSRPQSVPSQTSPAPEAEIGKANDIAADLEQIPPAPRPKNVIETTPLEPTNGPPPVPGLRRSFDAPLRALAVDVGDSELEPLVSYLKASFVEANGGEHRLIIYGTTDLDKLHFKQPYQTLVDKLMKQSSNEVPADLIRDFCDKNRERCPVWPKITQSLSASLLTQGEYDNLFANDIRRGWDRFYMRYPDSPGIITVSRVGLNHDKTLAFFYVGVFRGMLSAHGQLHVLKKQGNSWVELAIDIGPSWIS